MTPAARLQATIEILEQLAESRLPADHFIREWFRARRYAGSKDRAAIADRVFSILRHRNSLAWRMSDDSARALVIASVLNESISAAEIDALFDGSGYGPSPLAEKERSAIGHPPQGNPPLHVQGDFPEYLEGELKKSLGDALLDEMRATQSRAPVDLRVNTLKAAHDEVLAALRADGYSADATRWSTVGIRIPSGDRLATLRQSKLFANGAFEFQDEAAQIAALLADAKSGERILDLAAGAGGKALALAARMKNEGEIVATDIHPERLHQTRTRADRAGIRVIQTEPAPPDGPFDKVFVDAPCSGTGTWRRQPELRWRLTPARLAELVSLQDRLLTLAAARVRPGGRIIYATCSLLPCENEDRIAGFLAQHSGYRIVPARDVWGEIGAAQPPGMGEFFRATTRETGTDGFFVGLLARD